MESRFADVDATGVLTGYIDLDAVLGHLRPGTITVICGSASAGKSTMALGAAISVARHFGPTLFVSNELRAEELALRVLAVQGYLAGVSRSGEDGRGARRVLT